MKEYYINERLNEVDEDFLAFEEEMCTAQDRNLILQLLSTAKRPTLSNPHNSVLLYITGLTDEFDFTKGRCDTYGGSPPDIDIDFDALNREQAINWVIDKWGRDNVSNISSYGTFKPKSIAKSYYRVTEKDPKELVEIMKMIPQPKFGIEATLSEITEANPSIKKYRDFYEAAVKLEDMASHPGIHAAGIVISDFPIREVVPTWTNSTSERITQFDKDEVEDLGLIKFDFLSIDTITIIKETVKLIEKYKKIKIENVWQIPDGNKKAYQAINSGYLAGIFQFETSSKAAELINSIQPNSIEELSDISALNRPGPMQVGIDRLYIENKNRGSPPSSLPKPMADLLKSTYWTIVYQEQVMQVFSELAGFSLKEADDVRRAMGKKKKDVLEAYKDQFVAGFKNKTKLSSDYAISIWDDILGFADYCFNKSHSCAYSVITYVSAYLKANYPAEFFCALLTIRSQSQPKKWASKAPEYISEAANFGVTIYPPTVNGSEAEFVIKDNNVYFGLKAVRDVGNTGAKLIIKARGKESFKDIYDFLSRIDSSKVNLKVITALIHAGAFDLMGYQRKDLLDNIQQMMDHVSDLFEFKEKEIAISEREIERERIESILSKKESSEKRIKELTKLQKKEFSPNREIEIQELQMEVERIKDLKIKRLPALKPKEITAKPEVTRSKTIKVSLSEVIQQAYYIGCYINYHPVKMIKGNYDRLEEAYFGQRVNLCAVINSITERTTKTGKKMANIEIDDSTGSAEVTFFPGTWEKHKDLSLRSGTLLLNLVAKVELEEPLRLVGYSFDVFTS